MVAELDLETMERPRAPSFVVFDERTRLAGPVGNTERGAASEGGDGAGTPAAIRQRLQAVTACGKWEAGQGRSGPSRPEFPLPMEKRVLSENGSFDFASLRSGRTEGVRYATRSVPKLSLFVTAFVLVSFYLGLRTQDRIRHQTFSRAILALLMLGGVTLICRVPGGSRNGNCRSGGKAKPPPGAPVASKGQAHEYLRSLQGLYGSPEALDP